MSEKVAELEEIADNDRLYRRLSKISHINPKTGKVSSAAFKRNKQPDNSISADLARWVGAGLAKGFKFPFLRLKSKPAHPYSL